ncbi:ABC transporter ATP-binding protein [Haloferacaceae archaeon DSL9]
MSIIELDGVETFYGNSHILHGVSLAVDEGEVVTLLGRNGAGKTTTLRTIMGVAPPREGAVRYRGEDIAGLEPHEISHRGIKMVPEDRRIFPTLTVEENLSLSAKLCADARPVSAMYDLFPKLETLRSNKGDNLSGGEQQMLAVARALIQKPDVLLLDEPTEGLAPVIVDDLKAMIADVVAQDVTVLLTEQNVQFAFELAERGYIIDTGEIVYDGTVDEIRSRDDLLKEYLSVSARSR